MLPALRSGEALEIDGQEVTEVDIAGLQLLCSLHRGTVLQKSTVVFRMGQRGGIIEAAQSKAGFLRHKGCTPGCLWLESHHG